MGTELEQVLRRFGAARLEVPPDRLLGELVRAGNLRFLFSNGPVSIEQDAPVTEHGPTGHLAFGPGNTLVPAFASWAHLVAVIEPQTSPAVLSVRSFDREGQALLDIHLLRRGQDLTRLRACLARWVRASPGLPLPVPAPSPTSPREPAARRAAHRTRRLSGRGPAELLQFLTSRRIGVRLTCDRPGLRYVHTGSFSRVNGGGSTLFLRAVGFSLEIRSVAATGIWAVRSSLAHGEDAWSLELTDRGGRNVLAITGAPDGTGRTPRIFRELVRRCYYDAGQPRPPSSRRR